MIFAKLEFSNSSITLTGFSYRMGLFSHFYLNIYDIVANFRYNTRDFFYSRRDDGSNER